MTDRVEDELRAMLHGRAATVTDAGDPITGVETGVRRVVARRRRAVGAAVPLLAVAVVAGTSLLPGDQQHGVTHGSAGPITTAATSIAPVAPTQAAPVTSSALAGPSSSARASTPPAPPTPKQVPSGALPKPGSPQVEVFRRYLENDPAARKALVSSTSFGGRSYCALRVLDQTAHFADLAAFCQEYYLKDGALAEGSGSDEPVRLSYTGTGAATRVTGIAVPQSGHQMEPDLKRLFTPLAYDRWLQFFNGQLGGPGVDQSATQLKARAKQDVVTRRLVPGLNTAR
jgi:hypothetical protein